MYTPPVSSNILHVLCKFPIVALVITITMGGLILPSYMTETEHCNQTYVSFTFDDGWESSLNAVPILSKYGYVGTSFIITDAIGEPGYLTSEQIKQLSMVGWEIGSHGKTHSPFTMLAPAQLDYELSESKRVLESLDIPVTSVASPYGMYNDDVLTSIKTYYRVHRIGEYTYNDIPVDDPYLINAFEVKQTTTVEELKEKITYAKENHKWLVLIFHKIDDTSEYGYSADKFEEVVKFVYENRYWSDNILTGVTCQTCQL